MTALTSKSQKLRYNVRKVGYGTDGTRKPEVSYVACKSLQEVRQTVQLAADLQGGKWYTLTKGGYGTLKDLTMSAIRASGSYRAMCKRFEGIGSLVIEIEYRS